MNNYVGQIVPVATFVGQDIYGEWQLEFKKDGKTQIGYLGKKFVPHNFKINYKQILHNLIVIDFDRHKIILALDNYLEELITYYFNSFNPFLINNSSWQILFKNIDIPHNELYSVSIEGPISHRSNRLLNFYLIKTTKSIFPVTGFEFLNHLDGLTHFYPDISYFTNKAYKGIIYKTRTTDNFPKILKGQLFDKTMKTSPFKKDVKIFLHGFTYPTKWHYDVWVHLFQDKELSDLFEINFKNNVSTNVFNNCQKIKEDCSKNYCLDKDIYPSVHKKIKNICDSYLEKIVVFFKKETINRLVYGSVYVPFGKFKELDILCYEQIKDNKFLTIVLRGICYNWEDNIPILHFEPVTAYVKEGKPIYTSRWKNKNDEKNKNMVFPPITFFYGNLKEIEDGNEND